MVLSLPNPGFNQRISIVGGNRGVFVDLGQEAASSSQGVPLGLCQGVQGGLMPRVRGSLRQRVRCKFFGRYFDWKEFSSFSSRWPQPPVTTYHRYQLMKLSNRNMTRRRNRNFTMTLKRFCKSKGRTLCLMLPLMILPVTNILRSNFVPILQKI